jgi:hypothetical protein
MEKKFKFVKLASKTFGIIVSIFFMVVTIKFLNPNFFGKSPIYSDSDWFNGDEFIELSEDSTGVIIYKNIYGDFRYQINDREITVTGTSESIKGKKFLIEYNSQYSISLILNNKPIKFLSKEAIK